MSITNTSVDLCRVICLKSALTSYAKHKMIMTRSLTATRMLTLATEYTNKPYKRGQHAEAAADLEVYIYQKRSEIPDEKPIPF